MDSKGFIQLFNTKWSNTNLHYSKSAYSSYAIALVLCETWTDLSEHSRSSYSFLQRPFLKAPPRAQPLYLNQITAALHKGSGGQCSWDTAPAEPSRTQQQCPALHSPGLSGQRHRGHTGSPAHSLSTTRAGVAQPGRLQGAREMWAPLKRILSQLSVKDKLEVNVDKLN